MSQRRGERCHLSNPGNWGKYAVILEGEKLYGLLSELVEGNMGFDKLGLWRLYSYEGDLAVRARRLFVDDTLASIMSVTYCKRLL